MLMSRLPPTPDEYEYEVEPFVVRGPFLYPVLVPPPPCRLISCSPNWKQIFPSLFQGRHHTIDEQIAPIVEYSSLKSSTATEAPPLGGKTLLFIPYRHQLLFCADCWCWCYCFGWRLTRVELALRLAWNNNHHPPTNTSTRSALRSPDTRIIRSALLVERQRSEEIGFFLISSLVSYSYSRVL